jgi:hypothetical protein
MIEELALLPVQFDRHMSAAVQIGVYAPTKTNSESRLTDTVMINREAHATPTLNQFVTGADQSLLQARSRSHAASCATLAAQ